MRSGSQIHIKIGLFSFFLGSLFSCQTNPKQMEELSKDMNDPIVTSSQVEWLYTKNGKASFKLKTPSMLRYEADEPYVEFPLGLELHSFENDGGQDAFMTADYAIQHIKTQQVEAKGNVVLRNVEGEMLETEALFWDELNELIYTEAFVKITKQEQVIMGEGFESDIYFSEYTLKKSRGMINLERTH